VLGVDEGNFHILTFTTSRWREITISKAMDQTRATIIGLDPETGYSAEEARELAALFAGMRRLLEAKFDARAPFRWPGGEELLTARTPRELVPL